MPKKELKGFSEMMEKLFVTKSEFLKALSEFANLIEIMGKRNISDSNNGKAVLNNTAKSLEANSSANFKLVQDQTNKLIDKSFKKVIGEKTANIEQIVGEAIGSMDKRILGVEGRKGFDGEAFLKKVNLLIKEAKRAPLTGAEIRDGLELLEGEDKLAIGAVSGLEEQLKVYEEKERLLKSRGGGGGFSKIAMEGKLIDDESPSGTQNGTNKVFTLANTPNPASSLKVFRGGARQRVTEDYTLSGVTITFTIAPVSGEIILCDYRI